MTQIISQLQPVRKRVTVGEFVDLVCDDFDDHSEVFKKRARWWLNRVIEDLNNRHEWPWLSQTDSMKLTAGLAEYALPADCGFVMSPMSIEGLNEIKRRDPSAVIRLRATQKEVGSPLYFAQTSQSTVLFWPTPDSDYTVTFQYQKTRHPMREDDDEVDVPPEAIPVVMMGLVYRLRMADDRNDPATTEAHRTFERMIADLVWKYSLGQQDVVAGTGESA